MAFILRFSLTCSISYAQEYCFDPIAQKSYACVSAKQAEKESLTTVELGTCPITSAKQYLERIEKEYNLDLNHLCLLKLNPVNSKY